MKAIISIFITSPNLWDIVSLTIAVFAIIIAFGFRLRPRITGQIYLENKRIKVKLFNKNRYNRTIVDIKCEMTISDDRNFNGNVDTLELEKEWIVCLLKANKDTDRNYVFKEKGTIQHNKKYLRIRFLISNYLGIKKAYEDVIIIDHLENNKKIDSTFQRPF